MVPHQHVIQATESPWRWLLRCWRLRKDVRDQIEQIEGLQKELAGERDTGHMVNLELAALKEKFEETENGNQLARQGNAALLRFIHTRHRLSVPFDPESIRGILQKSDQ